MAMAENFQIVRSRMDKAATGARASVAAGFFDGVHLGHAGVLGAALGAARASGAEPWVFTFEAHPRAVLAPGGAPPPLLCPPWRRIALFREMGFAGVVLAEFDATLASLPPEDFASRLKVTFPGLEMFRCGENWRFGRNGAGTAPMLVRLAAERGFEAKPVPMARYLGEPISSTRIRAAVAAGDLAAAAAMLGRPFSISGKVARGRQVGSANGVATANIPTNGLATPPNGVYAVRAAVRGERFGGVADLGWRPTFHDARPDSPILEVHLFGFDSELYGQDIDVEFRGFIRGEVEFRTKDELFAQIARDCATAQKLLLYSKA